jgi:cytochrome c553
MKKLLTSSLGLAALIAFTVPAAADAPKADAAKAEAPAGASPEAIAAGKSINWDTADAKAKKAHMKKYVLPQMKKLFAAVDKKYAKMTCETCHGKKAADNKFKMPSADLPKLPQPTDRAGFMALQQKKPEVVKFMGTQVKPTMAALIGKPEWTEKTPDGFGCYGCHTKDESGAAAPPPAGAPPHPPATKPAAGAPAAPAKGGAW